MENVSETRTQMSANLSSLRDLLTQENNHHQTPPQLPAYASSTYSHSTQSTPSALGFGYTSPTTSGLASAAAHNPIEHHYSPPRASPTPQLQNNLTPISVPNFNDRHQSNHYRLPHGASALQFPHPPPPTANSPFTPRNPSDVSPYSSAHHQSQHAISPYLRHHQDIAYDYGQQFSSHLKENNIDRHSFPRGGKRKRNQRVQVLPPPEQRERNLTFTFMCLSLRNQRNTLSRVERDQHTAAGLGPKDVTFKANGDHYHLTTSLKEAFPPLTNIDGFYLLKATGGGAGINPLETIQPLANGWTPSYLRESCRIQKGTKIYVRPMQEDLPLKPLPTPQCTITITCKRCYRPLHMSDYPEHETQCTPDNPMPMYDLLFNGINPTNPLPTSAETSHVNATTSSSSFSLGISGTHLPVSSFHAPPFSSLLSISSSSPTAAVSPPGMYGIPSTRASLPSASYNISTPTLPYPPLSSYPVPHAAAASDPAAPTSALPWVYGTPSSTVSTTSTSNNASTLPYPPPSSYPVPPASAAPAAPASAAPASSASAAPASSASSAATVSTASSASPASYEGNRNPSCPHSYPPMPGENGLCQICVTERNRRASEEADRARETRINNSAVENSRNSPPLTTEQVRQQRRKIMEPNFSLTLPSPVSTSEVQEASSIQVPISDTPSLASPSMPSSPLFTTDTETPSTIATRLLQQIDNLSDALDTTEMHSPSYGIHRVHRSNIVSDMLSVFTSDDFSSERPMIRLVDDEGNLEDGVGVGVFREALTLFFDHIEVSHMAGEAVKVPRTRHDMPRTQWEAIARMISCGLKNDFFPLYLSPVFVLCALFGEESVDESTINSSFSKFLSDAERELLEDAKIDDASLRSTEFVSLLSYFEVCIKPTNGNEVEKLFLDIANHTLIQKPAYVAQCFGTVWKRTGIPNQFESVSSISSFFQSLQPTALKVMRCLQPEKKEEILDVNEARVLEILRQFVRGLDQKFRTLFLKFVTGCENIPKKIVVVFAKQKSIAPVGRSCGMILELDSRYDDGNVFSEEFKNILRSPYTWKFRFR